MGRSQLWQIPSSITREQRRSRLTGSSGIGEIDRAPLHYNAIAIRGQKDRDSGNGFRHAWCQRLIIDEIFGCLSSGDGLRSRCENGCWANEYCFNVVSYNNLVPRRQKRHGHTGDDYGDSVGDGGLTANDKFWYCMDNLCCCERLGTGGWQGKCNTVHSDFKAVRSETIGRTWYGDGAAAGLRVWPSTMYSDWAFVVMAWPPSVKVASGETAAASEAANVLVTPLIAMTVPDEARLYVLPNMVRGLPPGLRTWLPIENRPCESAVMTCPWIVKTSGGDAAASNADKALVTPSITMAEPNETKESVVPAITIDEPPGTSVWPCTTNWDAGFWVTAWPPIVMTGATVDATVGGVANVVVTPLMTNAELDEAREKVVPATTIGAPAAVSVWPCTRNRDVKSAVMILSFGPARFSAH